MRASPTTRLAQPVDEPVVAGRACGVLQHPACESDAAGAASARDWLAEVSQTAGTFVCNQVFYGLMHFLATRRGWRQVRGGFIHVPWLPEQGTPSMPLEGIVHGLRLAVRVALTTVQDLHIAAGQTH
jgi:pyroglutamyl-peptidase